MIPDMSRGAHTYAMKNTVGSGHTRAVQLCQVAKLDNWEFRGDVLYVLGILVTDLSNRFSGATGGFSGATKISAFK